MNADCPQPIPPAAPGPAGTRQAVWVIASWAGWGAFMGVAAWLRGTAPDAWSIAWLVTAAALLGAVASVGRGLLPFRDRTVATLTAGAAVGAGAKMCGHQPRESKAQPAGEAAEQTEGSEQGRTRRRRYPRRPPVRATAKLRATPPRNRFGARPASRVTQPYRRGDDRPGEHPTVPEGIHSGECR